MRWHILRHSKDPTCRALFAHRLRLDRAGVVGTGRPGKTSRMKVVELESAAHLEKKMPQPRPRRRGLGYGKCPPQHSERRQILDLLKKAKEHDRLTKLHGYEMQSSWMVWGLDKAMQRDLSWQKVLYQMSAPLLKFYLNAQLNTLPSPDNLSRWGQGSEFRCTLCGRVSATLSHILAGCP